MTADGHREILGVDVTSAEDGAGLSAFFRDRTVRGLSGVSLVTSDAHSGGGGVGLVVDRVQQRLDPAPGRSRVTDIRLAA